MFGANQAGAWKTLSREISPDIVVGASVGALNGWLIAGGAPAEELERRWLDPSSGAVMTYRTRRAAWQTVFDPGPLEATAKSLLSSFTLRLEYGVAVVELDDVPFADPVLTRSVFKNCVHGKSLLEGTRDVAYCLSNISDLDPRWPEGSVNHLRSVQCDLLSHPAVKAVGYGRASPNLPFYIFSLIGNVKLNTKEITQSAVP